MPPTPPERRTIRTNYLARVEGEGAIRVRIAGGEVKQLELRIYEPPRFFEAFLRGRGFREAPDITARICGICPVAYQMSAVQALEDACGVEVTPEIRALRRLLYCGEWIQSHALHVYLLHAPDFLGYESAIHLARDDAGAVERGLALKRTGNELMRAVGGREVHPVNVQVGGFYRAPSKAELAALRDPLQRAREAALATVGWTAGFDFPDFEGDWELVSLRTPGAYPLEGGRVVSDAGVDVDAAAFDGLVVEEHVPHSTALHAHLRARGRYLVGPLARYALNRDELSPAAREAADAAGLGPVCRNPFRSIVVRAVELVYACDEALRLIDAYEPFGPAAVPVEPRAGVGHGVTEAPRGLLHHRYALDAEGTIVDARIVPPTSQNQAAIEDDVRGVVGAFRDLPDDELGLRCEQTIRNYDPCISCATHFLTLEVDRR